MGRSKVYQIWCEWDAGQEGLVFSTEELAWKYAKTMIENIIEYSFEDAKDAGLVGVENLEMIHE